MLSHSQACSEVSLLHCITKIRRKNRIRGAHTYTHKHTQTHSNTHIHTHHLQHWDANTRIKDYEYKKRINNEASLEEITISLLFRINPSEIESFLTHFHIRITKERDRSLFTEQS